MKRETKLIVLEVMRWIARVMATLSAILILIIFIGSAIEDGIGGLYDLPWRDRLMFVAFGAVWLGLVLGWKWELLSGLLIVIGSIAFHLIYYIFSGGFPRGTIFWVFAIPGIIYLIYVWQIKKIADLEIV
jgi:hypothetical protein